MTMAAMMMLIWLLETDPTRFPMAPLKLCANARLMTYPTTQNGCEHHDWPAVYAKLLRNHEVRGSRSLCSVNELWKRQVVARSWVVVADSPDAFHLVLAKQISDGPIHIVDVQPYRFPVLDVQPD